MPMLGVVHAPEVRSAVTSPESGRSQPAHGRYSVLSGSGFVREAEIWGFGPVRRIGCEPAQSASWPKSAPEQRDIAQIRAVSACVQAIFRPIHLRAGHGRSSQWTSSSEPQRTHPSGTQRERQTCTRRISVSGDTSDPTKPTPTSPPDCRVPGFCKCTELRETNNTKTPTSCQTANTS